MNSILTQSILYILSITLIYSDSNIAAIISFSIAYLLSCKELSPNIIFIARQSILFIITLIIYINISNGYLISVHLTSFQNNVYGKICAYIGVSAIYTSHITLKFSEKIHIKQETFTRKIDSELLLLMTLATMATSGYLISLTKEITFVAAYGTYESEKSSLGNLNVIVATLGMISIKILNDTSKNKFILKLLTIFVFAYVSIWCMFIRGIRMDVIALIASSYIYTRIIKEDHDKKIPSKFIIYSIIFIIIFQAWGILRSVNLQTDDVIAIALSAFQTQKDFSILYQGTFNDISATFTGIVGMIDMGIINHAIGETYYEYILRTPPEFIYRDRPESPAWIFNKNGFTSGGGFYELAEGYYNFGFLGAIFQSIIISAIIGLSYKIAIKNPSNIYLHIPIISILAAFVRGSIYESFNFYKSFITVIIIVMIITFIKKHILRR